MIAAAAKGAHNSIELADNLAKLKNFVGVTGTMTIDNLHNPIKSAVMVKLDNGVETSADTVTIKK